MGIREENLHGNFENYNYYIYISPTFRTKDFLKCLSNNWNEIQLRGNIHIYICAFVILQYSNRLSKNSNRINLRFTTGSGLMYGRDFF